MVLVVCVILCNQLLHVSTLYREKKTAYVQARTELLLNTLSEFNLMHENIGKGNVHSYDPETKELMYYIGGQIKAYPLNAGDDIRIIRDRAMYDLRNLNTWKLAKLRVYLQEKQDSQRIELPELQLFVSDSTGKVKDAWPEQNAPLPAAAEFRKPLGFLCKDTLTVAYNYPRQEFVRTAGAEIFSTIAMSLLLAICASSLFRTIRREKKTGKFREMLMYNIIHNLKQPINNQIKICEMAKGLPLNDMVTFLEKSRQQLNEMLQSVNRTLFLSVEANGLKLDIQEFNIKEMLDNLTEKERWHTAPGKQVDFKTDYSTENLYIKGDWHLLFAVFQNFIDNSLKYSGDRVEIRIACSAPDNRHVRISFRDNGMGIPQQHITHVFDRFYRGTFNGENNSGGQGLGLHYARIIIRAHRGNIGIESKVGEGTTVTVCLPRNPNIRKRYRNNSTY